MRILEQYHEVEEFDLNEVLDRERTPDVFRNAVYFDLEHYVYKRPICVGVFGSCYYDEELNKLAVVQYMIENRYEVQTILLLVRDYFQKMSTEFKKKYVVTFSGNNDFTVINYLFNQHKIDFDIKDYFEEIDLQKEFSKISHNKENIGLKNLEKIAGINRKGELMSGATIAKTFSKIIKDSDYINRIPEEKVVKILNYNCDDVINLFYIYVRWQRIKKFMDKEDHVGYKEDFENIL